MSTTNSTIEAVMPYETLQVEPAQLGLENILDQPITIHRLANPANTLLEARQAYSRYGVAVLAPNCPITVEGESTTAQLINPVCERVLADWREGKLDPLLRSKDYVAYNDTQRHMKTIAFESVTKSLGYVLKLQEELAQTVQFINQDPTTKLSVDPDEGTVINLQVFPKDGEPTAYQQHGAHADRVDITAVVCITNIGPHGDFVFVDGYNEACAEQGLDPHRHFTDNLKAITQEDPEAIQYRVHPINIGRLVIANTDRDIHFITPKTLGDVRTALTPELSQQMVHGDQLIGRGIVNMAFETGHCRQIDTKARQLESDHQLANLHGEAFFSALDKALAASGEPVEIQLQLRNACVTRLSAHDLYA